MNTTYLFRILTFCYCIFLIACNSPVSYSSNEEDSDNAAEKETIALNLSAVRSFPLKMEKVGKINMDKGHPLKASRSIKFERNKTERQRPKRLSDYIPEVSVDFNIESLTHKWREVSVSFPEPNKAYPPVFRDRSSLNIKYLDQDQGLISSYPIALHHDSRGWLWVGSFFAGFSMYNGNVFYHFDEEQGLSENNVVDIEEDQAGNIYIAMTSGLVLKYDGVKFYELLLPEFEDITINNLSIKDDQIWLSTANKGVVQVLESGSTQVTIKGKEPQPNFNKVIVCDDGNLWLGSLDDGIFYLEGKTLYHFQGAGELNFSGVWDMYEDHEGHLWIATDNDGVIIKDDDAFWQYDRSNGLPFDNYLSLFQDSKQRIWLGSYGGGLTRVESDYFVHFSEKEGLSMPYIWEIEEDNQGNIWLGTDGGGINKIESEYIYNLTDENGLPNSFVFGIDQQGDGDIWLATFGGGVTRMTGDKFIHYDKESNFPSSLNNDIKVDDEGRVWVASDQDGLFVIHGGKYQKVLPKNGSKMKMNTLLNGVNSKTLWVGTEGEGIYQVKENEVYKVQLPAEISDIKVKSMMESVAGDVFIASSNHGLIKISNHVISVYDNRSNLPSNAVYSVYEDNSQRIWVGFGGAGLYQWTGDTLLEIPGLSNGFIWSFLQSNDSTFWVGTEKGLNRLSAGGNVTEFRKSDGLKSDGFFLGASYKDRDGYLWFGSDKSLILLDENQVPDAATNKMLEVNIHQVNIKDEFFDYRSSDRFKYLSVEPFSNIPNGLELPNEVNHLTIHFSALSPKSQRNVSYKYRIRGISDDWSKPTDNAFVDLRNLPNGDFIFEVVAREDGGSWGKPDTFAFNVKPPVWNTPLAYMVYALLVTMAFYFFVKMRFKQLHERQRWLELRVKKATSQFERSNEQLSESNENLVQKKQELENALNELKTTQKQLIQSEKMSSLGTLSSGIAHEINNSLNFIQGGIFGLNQYLNDQDVKLDAEVIDLLKTMDDGLLRASKIVKSLSYFNRSPETNHHVCNVNELLTDCLWMLHNKVKHRITIVNEIAEQPIYVLGNSSKLYQAFLNVISNAEEAIPEEGRIEINSKVVGDQAMIVISDNGLGIPGEIIDKITDPFFTTKGRDKSTGLGLTLTYNFVTEYQGTLQFNSVIGQGTNVIIQLPVYDAVTVDDVTEVNLSVQK